MDVNAHFTPFHVRPCHRIDCRRYSRSSTLRNPPCVLGQYNQKVAAKITTAMLINFVRLTVMQIEYGEDQAVHALTVGRVKSDSTSASCLPCLFQRSGTPARTPTVAYHPAIDWDRARIPPAICSAVGAGCLSGQTLFFLPGMPPTRAATATGQGTGKSAGAWLPMSDRTMNRARPQFSSTR